MIPALVALFSVLTPNGASGQANELAFVKGEFNLHKLLKVIRPQADEDSFDTIPWQISLWNARILAAKEGKPILLWEMDGHPLGCG